SFGRSVPWRWCGRSCSNRLRTPGAATARDMPSLGKPELSSSTKPSSAAERSAPKERRSGAAAVRAGFVEGGRRTGNKLPLPTADAESGHRVATVGCGAGGRLARAGTCSGDDRFGYQLVTEMRGALRQRLDQPQLIRLLVGVLALAHVLLAVLEQAVDALGDLAGGGHHGFGA